MKIHFVYAGIHYREHEEQLKLFILAGMNKYKLKKVMLTKIDIWREYLITKEKMENVCMGKECRKESVNDDLESLFEDIRLGKEPDTEALTYFLPKLTKEELELVDQTDNDFMNTFYEPLMADVEEDELKASESDSKYVHGWGWRKTFTIENSLPANGTEKTLPNQHTRSTKQKVFNHCSSQ